MLQIQKIKQHFCSRMHQKPFCGPTSKLGNTLLKGCRFYKMCSSSYIKTMLIASLHKPLSTTAKKLYKTTIFITSRTFPKQSLAAKNSHLDIVYGKVGVAVHVASWENFKIIIRNVRQQGTSFLRGKDFVDVTGSKKNLRDVTT